MTCSGEDAPWAAVLDLPLARDIALVLKLMKRSGDLAAIRGPEAIRKHSKPSVELVGVYAFGLRCQKGDQRMSYLLTDCDTPASALFQGHNLPYLPPIVHAAWSTKSTRNRGVPYVWRAPHRRSLHVLGLDR